MDAEMLWAVRICGLAAIVGAILYSIGDTLLLAEKFDPEAHPRLQPHLKLLSGMERMAGLPWGRMAQGGLLGVFAAPLLLAGNWQVYTGLAPAGLAAALPPAILLVWSGVVGAFGHGSFIYMGEYVQALDQVDNGSQPVLLGMYSRLRKLMVPTFAFLMGANIIASLWYTVLVAMGETAFPRWMAAVNPLTAFLAWVVIKKVLPRRVVDATEGAGFNIAYLIFYLFTTITLWKG